MPETELKTSAKLTKRRPKEAALVIGGQTGTVTEPAGEGADRGYFEIRTDGTKKKRNGVGVELTPGTRPTSKEAKVRSEPLDERIDRWGTK